MKRLTLRLLGVVLAVVPASALAGGVSISEVNARASGRATAASTLYDSASAIYFNPANISRLPGLNAELGAFAVMPKWEFTPVGATGPAGETKTEVSTPVSAFASYNFGDFGIGPLAVGLGFYVPYGSSFEWEPDDWVGADQVQKLELNVFEISPVVALHPHKKVAVGFGMRILPASIYLRRAVLFGDQAAGTVELGGRATAVGASAGISFWPIEEVTLAASWRSATTLKFEGDSNFEFPAPFDQLEDDRDARAELPLAQVLRLGAGWDIIPKRLNISADFEIQFWEVFKELAIDLIDDDGVVTQEVAERRSTNSIVVHSGIEYRIVDKVAVRAGYAYDQHTIPERNVSPLPPDSDRHLVSVGGSFYINDRFSLHGYFSNAFFVPRETLRAELTGTYRGGWAGSTMAYLFGGTLQMAFDIGSGKKDEVAMVETTPVDVTSPATSTEASMVEAPPASPAVAEAEPVAPAPDVAAPTTSTEQGE